MKKIRKKYNKATIPIIQEMNKLYDSGFTQGEIAEKMDFSRATIGQYIWHPRSGNESNFTKLELKEKYIKDKETLIIINFLKLALSKEIINEEEFSNLEEFGR